MTGEPGANGATGAGERGRCITRSAADEAAVSVRPA